MPCPASSRTRISHSALTGIEQPTSGTWRSIGAKLISAGDLFIWNFPNARNPQKVQRFPTEWAAALRDMAAMPVELFVPAHGLPIEGARR
ncbi:MAG: glyoxylase-like metal-dependent hydrolase (beta-lactamase superfamily II) [Candidatus Poriferisodalaceae bacterium]